MNEKHELWDNLSVDRRQFIMAGTTLFLPRIFRSLSKESDLTEARWYSKLDNNYVQCNLCFRKCNIPEGGKSYCTNRMNKDGKLYTLVYNKIAAIQIDPVEKEPLLHFLPGTKTLCFGTAGCNFRCNFCHNWHISTKTIDEVNPNILTPEAAVAKAKELKCTSVSFTYNEPTVFYEWVYDVVKLAKEKGIKTYIHTNGGINPEPLKELLKYLDAVCIDLKSFITQFYQITSFSDLDHVLNTLKILKASQVWFEIVNLVITSMNDDLDKIKEMCLWIRNNIGTEVPLHFSRFFPAYKLTQLPPTSINTLEKAREIALNTGIEYVTIGNVPGHTANSTFCPACKKNVIKRSHFAVLENNIKDDKCKFCGHRIPGVWA